MPKSFYLARTIYSKTKMRKIKILITCELKMTTRTMALSPVTSKIREKETSSKCRSRVSIAS